MEEVVENMILPDGMRRMRIIGDASIDPLRWALELPDEAVRLAEFYPSEDKTLGLHTLVITWPARDAMLGFVYPSGEKVDWPVVLWRLVNGDRVSAAIRMGADVFERTFGRRPHVAVMSKLPETPEEFPLVDGVSLAEASWAYPGCVFIGG